MKIMMKLLSDTVFGNGESIPGGEDIALLCDDMGFPYYKGGSFKGIFREELERYLSWKGDKQPEAAVTRLLGKASGDDDCDKGKIIFSDFVVPENIKAVVLREVPEGIMRQDTIMNAMSHLRTFTAIDENGTAAKNSLRTARCVNKGLCFVSNILCDAEDEKIVREILPFIKWIGSMRNRGFGKIELKSIEEER